MANFIKQIGATFLVLLLTIQSYGKILLRIMWRVFVTHNLIICWWLVIYCDCELLTMTIYFNKVKCSATNNAISWTLQNIIQPLRLLKASKQFHLMAVDVYYRLPADIIQAPLRQSFKYKIKNGLLRKPICCLYVIIDCCNQKFNDYIIFYS